MSERDSRHSIAIPDWFLTDVAPHIREMAELQVMLAFFRLQQGDETWSRVVSDRALLRDEALLSALRLEGAVQPPDEQVWRGISLATARDTLLQLEAVTSAGERVLWLLLATPENRVLLERYRRGDLELPEDPAIVDATTKIERARPGVFQLYEQNVGLVTPIIADRLVEAMELYPEMWIEDAIATAVSYNRRNWRYIQRILETWATEGRSDETNRRHQSSTGDLDPEKHLTGEYAAIFRRRRSE
jgi:DNA replication protein